MRRERLINWPEALRSAIYIQVRVGKTKDTSVASGAGN